MHSARTEWVLLVWTLDTSKIRSMIPDVSTKLRPVQGESLPLNKQERDQPAGRAVVVQDDDAVVVQIAHVAEPALAGLAEEYASPAVD
jgi:hypothetical protein